MTMNESPDPLHAELLQLTAAEPAAEHSARVRARCHATMTAARRPRPVARALDRLLPVAVLVYAAITIVEGLRMAGVL
jgi:hypothetical protein